MCYLQHSVGNCTDYEERFYYDPVSDRCRSFLYGGCHGNQNNFETIDQCRLACQDKTALTKLDQFPIGQSFFK